MNQFRTLDAAAASSSSSALSLIPSVKISRKSVYQGLGMNRIGTEASGSETFTLETHDGRSFVMDKAVAKQSSMCHRMMNHGWDSISLDIEISDKTLEKVIGYCVGYDRSDDFNMA